MRLQLSLISAVTAFHISAYAQTNANLEGEFQAWIESSAHEITGQSLESPNTDLWPIANMIGNARIVGLSESLHAAAEPVVFRNRLFKYLVAELGFKAIIIESGILESKAVNDYVTGLRDDLGSAMLNGFSNRFDMFEGNYTLIQWLRSHNDSLSDGQQKVQIFGMDVSGSPPGIIAITKPDAAIRYTLNYLDQVDAQSSEIYRERVELILPDLASGNGYGQLSQPQRDMLTATIEDMISQVSRQQLEYTAASNEYDYSWALRAAIAARQTDSWFRRMPLDWTPSGNYEWTSESQNIRDQVMADNLEWVLDQLSDDDRVFVFASVNHIGSQPQEMPSYLVEEDQRQYLIKPFGYYAKSKHGDDYTAILNLVGSGEIKPCFRPDAAPIEIEPPRPDWVESKFHGHALDEYIIDLRDAPAVAADWLAPIREQRNASMSVSGSFDIVYYIASFTHDCR